ncbi:hypothetical protein C7B70_13920 [Chlorogloea sp. CCALA 695]|nr:hypothetical protein C7B70_13920 [Chlorogloea sp. CCALA 695]
MSQYRKHIPFILHFIAAAYLVSPFIVDFDAISISQSGKIPYYILYPAKTTFANSDSIELLLTENSNFRTVEGVDPGISLKQSEAVYGEATLAYNTQNESREQVKFANRPAEKLLFQPIAPNQDFAGIYPSQSGEYNEKVSRICYNSLSFSAIGFSKDCGERNDRLK